MIKNWRGLIKVLEVEKVSVDKQVVWKDTHLLNMLHSEGDEYILRVLFDGEEIPESYYFGLDDRLDILEDQTMDSIVGEPCTNGYERQTVDSSGQFDLFQTEAGIWVAKTPIVQFQAVGGQWGPVRNLFLTTQEDSGGYLIASVKLTSRITALPGEAVYVKMGLMLRNDETLIICE